MSHATPLPIPPTESPRRCNKCFYVLDHLSEHGYCPECGEWFDLSIPTTFTRKPPFVWWTFWLPALITATLFGIGSYAAMIHLLGYGWASVVGVPVAVGVMLGYNARMGALAMLALIVVCTAGIMAGLGSMNVLGVLCGLTLGAIAIVPLALGTLIGSALRGTLKNSKFSQKEYLALLLFGLLIIFGVLEGRHPHLAIVSTNTLAVIDATPEETWKAIQFYEQVRHSPPWLLRLTPCLRPAYTIGRSEKVGDIKICVYERGRLTKQITEIIPGKRLAFRVIEQREIETDGVRLVDGSFDLTPSADGKQTMVTLTTRYEPFLAPRCAFKWSEDLAVHTLHGHVLLGMKEDAEARSKNGPQ